MTLGVSKIYSQIHTLHLYYLLFMFYPQTHTFTHTHIIYHLFKVRKTVKFGTKIDSALSLKNLQAASRIELNKSVICQSMNGVFKNHSYFLLSPIVIQMTLASYLLPYSCLLTTTVF